jgi:hypothetical protein
MKDLEKEIRTMIFNVVKEYNREFLLYIINELKLDEEVIMKKYFTPYYYMPIIERELKRIDI